jgi:Spy/CpxP family protein refolding chaperone
MPEKNNGKWTDRLAVQKAFDRDPQHAYNVVNSIITPEQAAQIEALLVPQPSKEEKIASLQQVRETLAKHGVDTAAVDAKIDDLGKEKGGEADEDEENAQGQR